MYWLIKGVRYPLIRTPMKTWNLILRMPGILSYVIEVILNFESIIDLFNNFDLMIFELIIKFDRMESD